MIVVPWTCLAMAFPTGADPSAQPSRNHARRAARCRPRPERIPPGGACSCKKASRSHGCLSPEPGASGQSVKTGCPRCTQPPLVWMSSAGLLFSRSFQHPVDMASEIVAGESRASQVQAACIAFFVISPIFVALRVWGRVKVRSWSGLSWDDGTLLVAWIFTVIMSGLFMSASANGLGRHMMDLDVNKFISTRQVCWPTEKGCGC